MSHSIVFNEQIASELARFRKLISIRRVLPIEAFRDRPHIGDRYKN